MSTVAELPSTARTRSGRLPLPAATPRSKELSQHVQEDAKSVLDPDFFDYAHPAFRADKADQASRCGNFLPLLDEVYAELHLECADARDAAGYQRIIDYVTEASFADGENSIFWKWLGKTLAARFANVTPCPSATREPYRAQRDLKYACFVVAKRIGLDAALLVDPKTGALQDVEAGIRAFLCLHTLALVKLSARPVYERVVAADRTMGILDKHLGAYFKECDPNSFKALQEWRVSYDRKLKMSGKKKRK